MLLSSFSCIKDNDIEYFLHEKAIDFEVRSKARTYIIFNEEELTSKSIDQLTIYGYVTIALKVLSVPDQLSSNQRKQLDGLSAKIHGEKIKDFPCYLIGQLARNDNLTKENLPGEDLIQFAFDVIAQANEIVGGRIILIECKNEEKLISFYKNAGFRILSKESVGNNDMVQMIQKIQNC